MLSDIQQLLACRRLAIDTPQAVEPGEFGTSRGGAHCWQKLASQLHKPS